MYCVILFYSNNYAIWTQNVLNEQGLDSKMISVPRELSSDCGYCIRIKKDVNSAVRDILLNNEIEFDRIEDII